MTELYAMKVLRKSEVVRRKQIQHTKTERKVMGSMRHPYIVALKYVINMKFLISAGSGAPNPVILVRIRCPTSLDPKDPKNLAPSATHPAPRAP